VWHARVVVDVEIARSAKCPRGSVLVPRGLQRSAYMDFDGSLMMNFRYFFKFIKLKTYLINMFFSI
jgi:hypothetical protein